MNAFYISTLQEIKKKLYLKVNNITFPNFHKNL